MKKIDLKQGTQEWLDYRQTRIGASDMAVIMEISPYSTPHKLWEIKTGKRIEEENMAMKFGRSNEGLIRETYEALVGEFYVPCVVEHPEFDYLFASLDGLSHDEQTVLEIKCCNEKVWVQAQAGKDPEYYQIQVQQQLMCTGCKRAIVVFFHKENLCEVEVFPDEQIQNKILEAAKEFYCENMLKNVAPALGEKDYLKMDDDHWKFLENEAKMIYPRYKEAKKQWDDIKKKFLDLSDDGNCVGEAIKISKYEKHGSLDIKKMIEDGIDIEKYRKPSSYCSRVSFLK